MHASLCDLLADLVQNAIEANSTVIGMTLQQTHNRLSLRIADNGKGMDTDTLRRASNPFFSEPGKHRRRVGLGIPFLYQLAEQTQGNADITTRPGKGCTVELNINSSHIDTPPLGDVAGALLQMMTFEGDYDLQVERTLDDATYSVTRAELIDALGELQTSDSLILARTYLTNLEQTLNEDANHGKTDA